MTTYVITGRDVTFTIGGTSYDKQMLSAVLNGETIRETYETLDGKAYKVIDNNFTFDVEMLADWGASVSPTTSLCEVLWAAAETAPNTTIAVVFTAATGAVFSFNILPSFSTVGGSGNDAQTVSFSFQVVGVPSETFS